MHLFHDDGHTSGKFDDVIAAYDDLVQRSRSASTVP